MATAALAATPRKTVEPAGRNECVLAAGLCVTVPASWQRLGDVFDGLGFVAAEPHPGSDTATWPELTVAALAVQQNSGTDDAPTSLDTLVDRMLAPGDSSPPPQTLERSRTLLNSASAEIVRVQFPSTNGAEGAIEDVALIQGDGGQVYSIALRCAPGDFSRLEPVFLRAAKSWRTEKPAQAAAPAPAAPMPHHRKTDSGTK